MNITIQVTQEHIDEGTEGRCTNCPVALAIKEHLKPEYQVKVFGSHYNINSDTPLYLPDKVTYRINRFDDGFGMEPFEFELAIKQQYLKVG